jgi:deoxyribose-phosphate aldolase
MTPARDPRPEVWITGIGLVTPIGTGRDAFWAGVLAGRSAVRRIDRFDPAQFCSQVAAQIDDFIKTSTGKVTPAATLPVTLVMLEAIRDFEKATGKLIGMKPAGGIRAAKEAIQYLVVLYETLGPRWMTPDRFRFGASTLLNDVLMQIEKERTGSYQDPDHFTID